MKIKIFILVALVLCLTLSIGSAFADVVTFDDFANYDFVVYGTDSSNNYNMGNQIIMTDNKTICVGGIYQTIDLNADIYVSVLSITSSIGDESGGISQIYIASFIDQFSEEFLLTLSDGIYIYVDTDYTILIGVLSWVDNVPHLLSLSPLFVGYEKAVPIQSGLFVDVYNWFNDTFFSGEVPPLLETLSEEFSTIFAVLFVGCIIAIPLFLVWVLVKSVIAMSLFNR